MQIVCSKAELFKGIQIVLSAVSSKSTLPVLSNILIETKTNQLKLAATDLEVGVRSLIKAEVVATQALFISKNLFSTTGGDLVTALEPSILIRDTGVLA